MNILCIKSVIIIKNIINTINNICIIIKKSRRDNMNKMTLISFNSTHHAIRSEKLLKDKGYELTILPTPREITASCGISIAIDGDKIDEISSYLNKNEINIGGIYELVKDKNNTRQARLIRGGE